MLDGAGGGSPRPGQGMEAYSYGAESPEEGLPPQRVQVRATRKGASASGGAKSPRTKSAKRTVKRKSKVNNMEMVELLRTKLRGLSYDHNGQNPAKLFEMYLFLGQK